MSIWEAGEIIRLYSDYDVKCRDINKIIRVPPYTTRIYNALMSDFTYYEIKENEHGWDVNKIEREVR